MWVIDCGFEAFNLQLPHSDGVDVCWIERDLINHMAKGMPKNNQSRLNIDQVAIKNKIFIQVDSNIPQNRQAPALITNTARIDSAQATGGSHHHKDPKRGCEEFGRPCAVCEPFVPRH